MCLRSGEAKLRRIGTGLAQAIGLQSFAADIGFSLHMGSHTGAAAAIGIARRRGIGRIIHLDVIDLWFQEQLKLEARFPPHGAGR